MRWQWELERCFESMDLEVRVMTHAIPHPLGITLPAMVVLPVKQPVLIMNGFVQTHTNITVCTVHISNILLFQIYAPMKIGH